MNSEQIAFQKLLKHALNAEVEASQMYFITTGETHDRDVKRFLNNLSKEEEGHFLTILKIFNKTADEGDHFAYTNEDREEAVKNITEKIRKAGINSDSKVEDIVRFAIKEEGEAQRVFSECLHSATDPSVKKILKKLINEEKGHEATLYSLLGE